MNLPDEEFGKNLKESQDRALDNCLCEGKMKEM